mmetsp:Transcript_42334/g.101869  ORF Transcript_42334/g.101869 Transcript_42334/m.101869 type:complete len:146 (+) Transcript_42334:2-439(+)
MVGAVDTRVKAMNRSLSLLVGQPAGGIKGAGNAPATADAVLHAVAALAESFREHQEAFRQHQHDTKLRLTKIEEFVRAATDYGRARSGSGVGQRDVMRRISKGRVELGEKTASCGEDPVTMLPCLTDRAGTKGIPPCLSPPCCDS